MPRLVWVSDGEPHLTVATKTEQSPAAEEMEVLQVMPQRFLIGFVGIWGKEEATCMQCWGQRAEMQQSTAPSRHRAAPGSRRFLTPSSASPHCLCRGPHRCKYE